MIIVQTLLVRNSASILLGKWRTGPLSGRFTGQVHQCVSGMSDNGVGRE